VIDEEKYGQIRKSTVGLMFFGTPHCGGNWATTAGFIASIASICTGEPRNNLLSTLKRRSLYNEATTDDFNKQLSKYDVVSFYEERRTSMKVYGWRIIPQLSKVGILLLYGKGSQAESSNRSLWTDKLLSSGVRAKQFLG
jgi:hypothetical protein